MAEPVDRSFTSQRLRLHYVEWGPADAPPLLLVHGGRDHARSWDAVAAAFASRWRVIAPDLRGHGDSAWASDGGYAMHDYVYDLAELIRQRALLPLPIVGHSLGGNIALRYTGLFPDAVTRLVLIEGLGPSPKLVAEEDARDVGDRLRRWIGERRTMSERSARRYPTLEEAVARMQAANPHLAPDQARHLALHGTRRNDDGSLSFKHDPALFPGWSVDITTAEKHTLWRAVRCPTLLVYGRESWASNPAEDGRAAHFRDARVELFDDAGHWVHHDRRDDFIALVRTFLED